MTNLFLLKKKKKKVNQASPGYESLHPSCSLGGPHWTANPSKLLSEFSYTQAGEPPGIMACTRGRDVLPPQGRMHTQKTSSARHSIQRNYIARSPDSATPTALKGPHAFFPFNEKTFKLAYGCLLPVALTGICFGSGVLRTVPYRMSHTAVYATHLHVCVTAQRHAHETTRTPRLLQGQVGRRSRATSATRLFCLLH